MATSTTRKETRKKLSRGLVCKESRHSLKRHLFLAVPRSPIKTNHDFLRVLQGLLQYRDRYHRTAMRIQRLRSFENFIFALPSKTSFNQEISTFRLFAALFPFNLWLCFLKTGIKLLQMKLKRKSRL